MDDLKILVETKSPSAICIVETWLSDDVNDSEISIQNYHITRHDRNRHGGGVLIYIHNSLFWDVLSKGCNDLEFIALSVRSCHSSAKHCICVLYRPPSSPISFFDNFCSTLSSLSPHSYSSFVLLGDFNIDFSDSTHHNFCKLQAIASLHSLTQMVSDPTHASPGGSSTIIDLVFVSNENTVVDCSTTPPLANSDHSGLQVQYDWRHSGKQIREVPRQIWCFKDADFEMTCNMLYDVDWDAILVEDDIDVSAANWHYQFMEIMEACIPRKTLRCRKNLPWLTRDITRAMRKRNAAFRASKTSASP